MMKKSPLTIDAMELYAPNTMIREKEFNPDASVGREFNLVRLVREHAPVRLQKIRDEVKALENKLYNLETESRQLERLLQAVQEK